MNNFTLCTLCHALCTGCIFVFISFGILCSQTSLHELPRLLGLVPEKDLEKNRGLSYLHSLGGSETSSPPSVCVPPDFSSHLHTDLLPNSHLSQIMCSQFILHESVYSDQLVEQGMEKFGDKPFAIICGWSKTEV
eukprot:Phypoly_transcript_27149.p1 GENE.Phypoly_transcript_27149~~Phypoly_transcript_27149.p1  ORF type:complete len:135 (-),score=11.89 Phypoly_transcript_27149:44-448(-)